MAVRIFETDPDAKPKRRTFTKQEFAFFFRSGMSVYDEKARRNLPVSLEHWRVTTPDPATAEAIAQLYGGEATEWDTPKDDAMQVLTTRSAVQIVLSGPKAIEDRLIQWGRKGPIHECDGITSLMDRNYGEPCGCPELLMERKAAARDEMGPAPHIKVTFRLADDYDLGVGQFTSTSWDLLISLADVENELSAIDGEALCELSLELVEYTTKKGRDVSYRKPVITVIEPWADALTR
ncbi:hypothetical protein AB0958_21905 [Streptomyces sp. NPDC006655]|uniref:recombination directionality factor n=1 Tax=Streptomyces sp. NPDC006655 TaxID=3156898 RepID=UPI0034553661